MRISLKWLVLVFIALLAYAPWASKASDSILSDYASTIVGQAVEVHCIYMTENEGYTQPMSDGSFEYDIWLKKGVCRNIKNLLLHKPIYNYGAQSWALTTIIHESYHIKLLSTDESLVECTAMRNIWGYIVKLDYTPRDNKRLYETAWIGHSYLPEEYTKGCKPPSGLLIETGLEVIYEA